MTVSTRNFVYLILVGNKVCFANWSHECGDWLTCLDIIVFYFLFPQHIQMICWSI